ncbi:MAG: SCO6880 family protein [Solirubrobacteraceae bacterium]
MSTSPPAEPRTYGGWRIPKSPGIMGLDLLSSAVLMCALIACIFTLLATGFFAAIGMGAVWSIALAVLITKDQHGRSGLERVSNRVAWQQAKFGGSQHSRSGPSGKARWGTFQLPGLLANTKLHEYSDAWGQRFAILELPTKGHYSITFRVEPEGSSLVDEAQVDQWVGNYAGVLKALGDEPGLIAAQITVETAPDTGARLRRHVEARIDPNAPEVAKAMLQDVM